MNAIEQHIDYLFQDLPNTSEIKRIKNDLYLNAMDRCDELIVAGKTESEAIGTVIIEMGDREELLENFDYNQEQDLRDYSLNTLGEAKVLIDTYQRESQKIGLGIIMILIGAGLVPTFESFNIMEIGVILLLVLVAMAVGLFIHAGQQIELVEQSLQDEDEVFYLMDDDYEVVQDQYDLFRQRERFRIPLGVMLCIVAVTPIIFFSSFGNDLLVERFGILFLLFMVGTGIFLFVTYGMSETGFQKVLNLGEYTVREQEFQKKVEPIASIYWMLATMLYFGYSFITGNWEFSWIIWPVAGMSWGIITLIMKIFTDRN